jgi:hypothetical protein
MAICRSFARKSHGFGQEQQQLLQPAASGTATHSHLISPRNISKSSRPKSDSIFIVQLNKHFGRVPMTTSYVSQRLSLLRDQSEEIVPMTTIELFPSKSHYASWIISLMFPCQPAQSSIIIHLINKKNFH